MATYESHRLKLRKVKIDNFWCLLGDIWILFVQKCLLSRPLYFLFFSLSLILIGCWGFQKKKILKNLLFRNCLGDRQGCISIQVLYELIQNLYVTTGY